MDPRSFCVELATIGTVSRIPTTTPAGVIQSRTTIARIAVRLRYVRRSGARRKRPVALYGPRVASSIPMGFLSREHPRAVGKVYIKVHISFASPTASSWKSPTDCQFPPDPLYPNPAQCQYRPSPPDPGSSPDSVRRRHGPLPQIGRAHV